MKYCNSLSMSKLNRGASSVFVGYKASCSVCAEGTLFYAQCSMINTQCIMHNSQ